MTDFGPVIANPKTLLLGAAAQVGIFVAFWGALATGRFNVGEASSIGIIGGADGPTTIFLSAILAPEILGITAVVAYTYMASVVFIQPPLMRLLTTSNERGIVMRPLREASQREKLVFPTVAMILIILIVPQSAPLIAMFMMGNLFRESGVVPRLADAASNELLNVATIFLMVTVGTQLTAERVFDLDTVVIFGLGLVAFSCGTIGGLLFAKLMNLFLREKINPLIGSAGVSAVPTRRCAPYGTSRNCRDRKSMRCPSSSSRPARSTISCRDWGLNRPRSSVGFAGTDAQAARRLRTPSHARWTRRGRRVVSDFDTASPASAQIFAATPPSMFTSAFSGVHSFRCPVSSGDVGDRDALLRNAAGVRHKPTL